ncbi:helix-turn-helix transcriptional regulator [Chania multitudinisentens]|nr:LuxR C-terminal-related transcriptional regulator [Chania multitudinisentens]
MKALLAQDILCLSHPSIDFLQNGKTHFNLIIMNFPEKIYLFEEYILFLKHIRALNPKIKTLFFIDKISPLVLSLIARAHPDAILDKKEKTDVVFEMCLALLQQEAPVANGHTWSTKKPPMITPGEVIVLCEIARNESINSIAQRLHLHPKTIYSHLNNASKKFGICNRVELLKMIAML